MQVEVAGDDCVGAGIGCQGDRRVLNWRRWVSAGSSATLPAPPRPAPATIDHNLAVLRTSYDDRIAAGVGPSVNPVPSAVGRPAHRRQLQGRSPGLLAGGAGRNLDALRGVLHAPKNGFGGGTGLMSGRRVDGPALYQKLRTRILSLDPSSVKLFPTAELPHVYGVVMDLVFPKGSATFVVMADGTTSLYRSAGGSIIG